MIYSDVQNAILISSPQPEERIKEENFLKMWLMKMYKQTTLKVINCPWYEPGWGCHNELLLASNIPSHTPTTTTENKTLCILTQLPPSPYSIETLQICHCAPPLPPFHTTKSSHPHGKHLKQKKWKPSSCEFFEATNLKNTSLEKIKIAFSIKVYYIQRPPN